MGKIKHFVYVYLMTEILMFLEIILYYYFTKSVNTNINMFYSILLQGIFWYFSMINLLFCLFFLLIKIYLSKLLLILFISIFSSLIIFLIIKIDLFTDFASSQHYEYEFPKPSFKLLIGDNYYGVLVFSFLLLNQLLISLLHKFKEWKFGNNEI